MPTASTERRALVWQEMLRGCAYQFSNAVEDSPRLLKVYASGSSEALRLVVVSSTQLTS